ncbi:MAG: histidine--tRNA ligase [Chthoniobacterales bacterium]|nr:histidine--tRNA ligase [Chthoniobacterales bacterium]
MQALPGFRDFLPRECAERNYIFARWRETARRYGFVEWDGPILEPTELFQKKSGPEIVTQLFNFTDKGEREVALRPELTPTLARIVAAHDRDFKKPLKWFSIAQCFRYEKQQRGRLREHFQLNCDIVGEGSLNSDVELIALAIDLLRALGFGADDFVVRISDREFWIDFLRSRDVAKERWSELLQIIDKSEREPRAKTAARLGDLAEPTFAILDGHGANEKLSRVMEDLRERGLDTFAKVDLSIVRGLAYYTGIVFEVFDRSGKFRAVAGGGRYDNLIAQLSDGAVSLPALGFAMGDVVLGDLIQEIPAADDQMRNVIDATSAVDIYIVIAKEERRDDAMRIGQRLRDSGRAVDYPFAGAKVGKQFQTAELVGARFAIVFGDEWPQVAVKNLANGEQQLVAQDELVAYLATSGSLSSRAERTGVEGPRGDTRT